MEQSLYQEYIDKFFKSVSHGVVTKLNDSEDNTQLTYLHRTMLRKEFSVSGKWETLEINNTLVAADYVAMDSSLPLKKRDSYGRASGDIPKMGIEMSLNEKQLTEIDTMIATNVDETNIAARLFNDVPRVIGGVYEKNEYSFLQGLSTGATLVESDKEEDINTGVGIRVDFGYKTENKFGVSKLWSDPTSTPMTDIRKRILAKAKKDGKRVSVIMLDSDTIANILATNEAKELFAASINNFGGYQPSPTLDQLNNALRARDRYVFQEVDRSVRIEKNGKQKDVNPWAAGAVVALTTAVVGTLTWATVAEDNHRNEAVTYEKPEDYILVSRFVLNRPSLKEVTNAQARVVPVISETVYLMDSLTLQA